MSEPTLHGLADSDRSNSRSESPNVEADTFSWGLEGQLGDNSLIAAMIHFCAAALRC